MDDPARKYSKEDYDPACCQKPQCPEDAQAPGYDNDTPNNWLRGNGCKPGFDYGKKGSFDYGKKGK